MRWRRRSVFNLGVFCGMLHATRKRLLRDTYPVLRFPEMRAGKVFTNQRGGYAVLNWKQFYVSSTVAG